MERDQATRFVHDLLRLLLSKKGSDLFITADFPPAFKIDGRVLPVSNQPLTSQHTGELVRAIMNDRQTKEFDATKECNFAIAPPGIGRFRVSAFVQQGMTGCVIRQINSTIPTIEELELPVRNALSKAGADFSCPGYDLESWHRYKALLVEGEEVVVTEKIHGASARFTWAGDAE